MTKHGLLLIGHGSKLQYSKELITKTAEMMEKISDEYIIVPCFMENSSPLIEDGLKEMSKKDIDLLVAAPLFLAKGVHVLHDIPEILGLNTGKFTLENGKKIPIVYAEPIGVNPLLAEIMLNNSNEAVQKLI